MLVNHDDGLQPRTSMETPSSPNCPKLPVLDLRSLRLHLTGRTEPAADGYPCPSSLPILNLLMDLKVNLQSGNQQHTDDLLHSVATGQNAQHDKALLYSLKAAIIQQNRAVVAHTQQLWRRILTVAAQLASTNASGITSSTLGQDVPAGTAAEKVLLLLQECDGIGQQLAALQLHVGTVIQQICDVAVEVDWGSEIQHKYKHNIAVTDHKLHNLLPSYKNLIEACVTGELQLDELLLGLSDCYNQATTMLDRITKEANKSTAGNKDAAAHNSRTVNGDMSGKAGGDAGQWRPPDHFRRSTSKFWIRLEDVPRLRVALLRHLPLLVIGRQEGQLVHEVAGCLQVQEKRLQETDEKRLDKEKEARKVNGNKEDEQEKLQETTELANEDEDACCDEDWMTKLLENKTWNLKERSVSSPAKASSAITSVYFDAPTLNAGCNGSSTSSSGSGVKLWPFAKHEAAELQVLHMQLPVYHSRLRRDDKSALVRLRWYGPEPDAKTGKVFIERKLHRDAWTGLFSVKERVPMPLACLPAFLSGEPVASLQPPKDKAPISAVNTKMGAPAATGLEPCQVDLLSEIQEYLTRLGQESVLRTQYQRYAFQRSDTNEVRISLDTNVCMLKEGQHVPGSVFSRQVLPTSQTGKANARVNGNTSSTSASAQAARVHFPYAILEIKLKDGDSCPDWVLACRQSGILIEVPKFSKFLHGMALLYPQAVRNTPPWFVPTTPHALPLLTNTPIPTAPGLHADGSKAQASAYANGLISADSNGTNDSSESTSDSGSGSPRGSSHSERVAGLDIANGAAVVTPRARSISAAQFCFAVDDAGSDMVQPSIMRPATIGEVEAASSLDCQDALRDWLFPNEISPEQWYDARNTKPTICGNNPSCSACRAAAHSCTAVSQTNSSSCIMSEETQTGIEAEHEEVVHTCALGRVWQMVTAWKLPEKAAPIPQAAHLADVEDVEGDSSTPTHVTAAVSGNDQLGLDMDDTIAPVNCASEVAASVSLETETQSPSAFASDSNEHAFDAVGSRSEPFEITLQPWPSVTSDSDSSCPTPTLKPSSNSLGASTMGYSQFAMYVQKPVIASRRNAVAESRRNGTETSSGQPASASGRCSSQAVGNSGMHFAQVHTAAAVTSPKPSEDKLQVQPAPKTSSVVAVSDKARPRNGYYSPLAPPASARHASNDISDVSGRARNATQTRALPKTGFPVASTPTVANIGAAEVEKNVHLSSDSETLLSGKQLLLSTSMSSAVSQAMNDVSDSGSSGRSRALSSRLSRVLRAFGYRRGRSGRPAGVVVRDEETGALPAATPLVRSRIEPKTFFAAERTFLSWINLAVMLMFVALSLLATAASFANSNQHTHAAPVMWPGGIPTSAGWPAGLLNGSMAGGADATAGMPATLAAEGVNPGSSFPAAGIGLGGGATSVMTGLAPTATGTIRSGHGRSGLYALCGDGNVACRAGLVSGLLIAPAGLILLAYALTMYRKRTAQILRRETVRYDDQKGPILLVILLLVLLTFAYALAFRSVLAG